MKRQTRDDLIACVLFACVLLLVALAPLAGAHLRTLY
jgi:hypothetical protein